MRSEEIIHRTAQFMGGKRQSSKTLRRANESKQLEATLITQAVIQASRLLTSGLLFGLVGRDQRPARRALETWSDDTGDDGSFSWAKVNNGDQSLSRSKVC